MANHGSGARRSLKGRGRTRTIPATCRAPSRRMIMLPLPPSGDQHLLVLGSLNANSADRTMERSRLCPVQALTADGSLIHLPAFDGWGALGVSAMAFTREGRIFATTGDQLAIFEGTARPRSLAIDPLADVHELSLIGDVLWLANTGRDEAVAVSIAGSELERVPLAPSVTPPDAEDGTVEYREKYHCNQVFEDLEGKLWGLVHHVSRRQLLRRVGDRLLKSHGDGGIRAIRSEEAVDLGLHAPHSVRQVGDEQWVLDSGRQQVIRYDRDWRRVGQIATRGWGRGAAVSSAGVYYAATSATRRRYLRVGPKSSPTPNVVEAFAIGDGALLGERVIEGVEQLNNIYLISSAVLEALLAVEAREVDALGAQPPG